MQMLYKKPLDQIATEFWNRIDHSYRKAFLAILGINLLAFGFEMTNLTLHHDDVGHIFIQDDILGHYLGRFGFGWLNYYTQNAYVMPFLQMVEGIMLMSAYGLLISHLWGLRNTVDVVIVSSVLCVFPYMAQLYQYNTSMAPFTLAHFLAASAVTLSIRATVLHVAIASVLYTAAFSIYQSVIASAATIFVFWALGNLLFKKTDQVFVSKTMVRSTVAALLSVGVGGLIYLGIVSSMELEFDSYQAAGQAFSFQEGLNLSYAASEIIKGTHSFFFWPEHYFPDYLKKLQLIFLLCAGILCLWLPRSIGEKIGAIVMLIVASLAPRLLQVLHPAGDYHSLTLTGYAVVIAGAVMIINRGGHTLVRNASIILGFFLVAGYILQCNWISTVNYLNTLAHYTTLTQVLTRIRALPDTQWDGKTIVVVGRHKMPSNYPFKKATGVASDYMDANHMDKLARLMKDDASIIKADTSTPGALEYAESHSAWPHPNSVAIVDGAGVVVFSKD